MSNQEPIENLLEAALFFRGGSMSVKDLAGALKKTVEEVEAGIASLSTSLQGRGLTLVRERDHVALGTAPTAHALIERMRKEELEGPLGKAGLETLAIILFRGPLARSDIEYIRGVNCSSILRSLQIRGLIDRIENPGDKRSFHYRATPELPAYFGIEELPRYAEMKEEIEKIFTERDLVQKEKESVPQEEVS